MPVRHPWRILIGVILAIVVAAVVVVAVVAPSTFELLAEGDTRDLREGKEPAPAAREPTVLILALDGVERPLLYDLLASGDLPELARLLGGREGERFPHAHLDDTALAPLPTSTITSWATIFTGVAPAEHGVAGNEYFVRAPEPRFVAPAPVSITAPDLVIQTYTDGYANNQLGAPTLYERVRARGRGAGTSWVAMSQYFRGADRLLLADRTVIADAFAAFLDDDDEPDDLEMFASLDREVIDNVIEELDGTPAPAILTVYLSGTDLFAHDSDTGPDAARRRYLREVIDPLVGDLRRALERQAALVDRHVVVVSDHGHTEVRHDARHALGTDDEDDPPSVVRGAGYRLRPFELDAGDARFDTVLAYGGALAYVYLADRAACGERGCDWSRPPRFAEDVVPLAEAFLAAHRDGTHAPSMKGSLDLILVRQPGSLGQGPFEVYLGGGRTEPLDEHLERHPRAEYVVFAERMLGLAVGPFGTHAGDILLVAHNGNEPDVDRRYYFSGRYYSWHGSPSRLDSEIPLIVAHPRKSAAELRSLVREVAGDRVDAAEITPLIERLLLR